MTAPLRINQYEILGQLAVGGMAEILLARVSGPSGFERPVVIKRILPHLAALADFRGMFVDEARIIARIRDDNVVQVHELGSQGDELFLAMEYLEGESVGGLLRRLHAKGESLDPWLGCHIVAQACAGLHAAHELTDEMGNPLNLVHRDISPQNVFITYAGGVKVLDFGVAKVADKSVRTATGQLKGKFQYMSPEQCQGAPLDRRSDVWALGVLLYELTTLTRPFKRATELLTFKAICEEPIQRPSQIAPEYASCIEPIVLRALSRDVDLRFATAKEMRGALLSAMREIEGASEPQDALGQVMDREFGERRREKREMLLDAARGHDVARLPVAEVDEQIELPAVTEMASAIIAPTDSSKPKASGLRRALALGVAVAFGAGIAMTLRSRPQASPSAAAPVSVVFAAPLAPPTASSAPEPETVERDASASVKPRSVAAPSKSRPRRLDPPKEPAPTPSPASKPKPPVDVPLW